VARTGIKSRHIADKNETASSMAYEASLKALEAANCNPSEIDLIIISTLTPDKLFPSTACILQKKLGISGCIAFDIQAACSGFVYALSIADKFIKTGTIKKALVVGSELMSRLIDWSDRDTCVLFGDGSGAVVLEASENPGILSTKLYADGSMSDLIYADNRQTNNYIDTNNYLQDKNNIDSPENTPQFFVQMQGKKVFKVAVQRLEELVQEIKQDPELSKYGIDWLVPHQANTRIISAIAQKLDLSMEQVICTIETHSNTSSASIPLALDTAVRDGRIKRGQVLLFEAFGGGLAWGSALVRY